jgi:nucleoside-diphosphate-sugar epimerase/SAM-dependent methyltransferase
MNSFMRPPLPSEDLECVLFHAGRCWKRLEGKRVLFTGASGFFGSWLLETFLNAGTRLNLPFHAIALTRDAARFSSCLPHLAGDSRVELLESDAATMPVPDGPVDFVIHSLVPDAETPFDEQEAFFRSATSRLLDIASAKNAEGFLLCSTGAVYQPHDPPGPFLEDDPRVPQDAPVSYGQIRRKVEDQCLGAWKERGLPVKIARGFAFVGPRLPLDAGFAIGNFIGDGLAGRPIAVKGDGTAVRSYLYAADMAAWLWTILLDSPPGCVFNVGSEEAICMADLARNIGRRFAAQPIIEGKVMPGAAPPIYVPCTSRAHAELGLRASTGLHEAIEKTIRFARMNSKTLHRPCPVCECPVGRVLHTQRFTLSEGHPLQDRYEVVACDACGFCFADTPVSQAAYDAYYSAMSKYADGATSTGAGHSPWDGARLDQLAGHVAEFALDLSSRILDVGCAAGGLLAALQARGYTNVCGIDPSPECVEKAREAAAGRVWTGTLSGVPAGIGTFDGIILSHVMEHVRDARTALELLRKLLNPCGWVYIEVPDATRYEQFLVAPFQDFNTEHINHFSMTSLANLFRTCGFAPEVGGTKEIFSAKDMPYPALFWFARVTDSPQPIERDDLLSPALEGYIRASSDLMRRLDETIRRALAAHPSVIVWGTGQLTMKLLAGTCLREANIEAFVDGNPVNQGKELLGRRVIGGRDLSGGATPILVCSLINSAAIIQAIRSLGLTNPVVELSDKPA